MRQHTRYPRTPRGQSINPYAVDFIHLDWHWVCVIAFGRRIPTDGYTSAKCFQRSHIFFGDEMSCPHQTECGWERKDNANDRVP